MVDHDIGHQLHPACMQLLYQLVKVLHRAEIGVNLLIICNIVTVIILWRDIDRLQPDNINSELLQII
ncbi:hypothetical protein D3C81_1282630 [compost metagenome]